MAKRRQTSGERKPHRWDVFWANLDPVQGSETGKKIRPVVVVSGDRWNKRFTTHAVVPLTSPEKGRDKYPLEVLVPQGLISNEQASWAQCHPVRVVDRVRFGHFMGVIRDESVRYAIEECLLGFLGVEYEVEEI